MPAGISLSYVFLCSGFAALALLLGRWLPGDGSSLVLAGLAVLLLGVRLVPAARRRWAGRETRWIVALALAATVHSAGPDLARFLTTPWVRVWNVFHYYLGAEYFAELGYNDLYVAALAADREGQRYWRDVDRVRNLATYEVESRREAERRFDPESSFSAARWRRFRSDVEALQPQRSPRQWRDIFRDRGYNPTPFWSALAHSITHLLPASTPWGLKVVSALDLLLYGLTFTLLFRTFGAGAGGLVLLFFVLSPVNGDRLVGGFLQYDWFCAIAAGLAFVKRRQALPAAACLAFASLARVFPAALVAALLAPELLVWLRTGRLSTWHRRFALAFAGFGLVGFLLGCTTGRGLEGWKEFAARITHHSELHTYGEQRVGLKHLFTRDLRSTDLSPNQEERREHYHQQKPLYRGVALLLLAALGLALVRRNPGDALLLGLVVVFAATVASRYYWACLALLPLVSAAGAAGQRWQSRLDLGQAALFAGFFAFRLGNGEAFAAYNMFNLLLLGLMVWWLGSWLLRDLRVWRRYSRSNQVPPTGSPVAGAISTR